MRGGFNIREIDLPPYAPTLIESTRAIGYSLEAAVADIIDNSIAADAQNVDIFFFPIDGAYIAILDDGCGMNCEEINSAMQYGSKNPLAVRDAKDLGRFGLGLKTASLSQCRVLTVVSKQGEHIEARRWDIDHVTNSGAWSLLVLENDDCSQIPHMTDLLKCSSGTLIVWQNLDRLKIGEIKFEESLGRKIDTVREHLALVYHRYLTGETGLLKLTIRINGAKVRARDPFLSKKSVQAMDDEAIIIHGEKIVVRPYILPHLSKLSAEEVNELGGKEGLRRQQGFYIYRNKRLLVWGTWFRMMRQGEMSKLVRIRVDIPNALDDLWTLDIKKSSAVPPAEIRANLRSIIDKMAEKSKRTWTYRGKRETSDDISHIWNRLKTRHGGYIYEINRDYPLIAEMIEAHPEIKAELSMLFRQIETGIPLNALYLDLTNDEKIENDNDIQLSEIFKMVKQILKVTDTSQHEAMIETLIGSEPFNEFAADIKKMFREGRFG